MESVVKAMRDASDDFVDAAATFLEFRHSSEGRRTPANDAALLALKDKLEMFKAACDRAEDLVITARHRFVAEFADRRRRESGATDRPAETAPISAASTASSSVATITVSSASALRRLVHRRLRRRKLRRNDR
ncbi:hypothetical protein HPP92_014371 [Vanilla planifolia]|uniref:Uncharacterized protein n=1 Tax=Vanilla planifolia TaxID=51239 RepID=A0A835QM74_VANPL|nr:hypothetical protein HPP92_014777 [Vanilla planifolia]KAG0474685.1 hypothetical protein HPP92_014371 [Vanilla planifolia]